MSAEKRLRELGIELPPPPVPLGAYVEAVRTGNLLFLSGALPIIAGEPQFIGRLGDGITIDDGRSACRLAALNALALARAHLGSLDRVTRIVRQTSSLATAYDFTQHAKVADAASEILDAIFGREKRPTRMVYGVSSLPVGVCAVLELLLEVE